MTLDQSSKVTSGETSRHRRARCHAEIGVKTGVAGRGRRGNGEIERHRSLSHADAFFVTRLIRILLAFSPQFQAIAGSGDVR